MKILTHRKFDKAFSKVSPKIQIKFYECVEIFLNNQSDKRLRNHALSGNLKDFWSIDITGDWRLLYERIDEDTVMFLDIGTHSQLYG